MGKGKRLGIVVPYRDRQEHLAAFLPHVNAYFARDKADKHTPVRILVVEQPAGLPFNRGLMMNIGFQLLKDEIDYVCFHDVDYLPIWTDYSCPDQPTMLVGYGLEPRPFQHRFIEEPTNYFSTVVLLQNEHVERANGYSNGYWGWGHEDIDFKHRLEAVGLTCEYRWGTFSALDHDRRDGNTFDAKGRVVRSPVSQRNWEIFCRAWEQPRWQGDGLSSLSFTALKREPIDISKKERDMAIERVLVDFTHRPAELPVPLPTLFSVPLAPVPPRSLDRR
jgi:hypothetical protein